MSFIQNIYFLNHFINVSSNFYTTGHVHPRILYIYIHITPPFCNYTLELRKSVLSFYPWGFSLAACLLPFL
jgi:hypothetical protein